MVEHSTADREVPGSNPGAPSNFFLVHKLIIFLTFSILFTLPQPTLIGQGSGKSAAKQPAGVKSAFGDDIPVFNPIDLQG